MSAGAPTSVSSASLAGGAASDGAGSAGRRSCDGDCSGAGSTSDADGIVAGNKVRCERLRCVPRGRDGLTEAGGSGSGLCSTSDLTKSRACANGSSSALDSTSEEAPSTLLSASAAATNVSRAVDIIATPRSDLPNQFAKMKQTNFARTGFGQAQTLPGDEGEAGAAEPMAESDELMCVHSLMVSGHQRARARARASLALQYTFYLKHISSKGDRPHTGQLMQHIISCAQPTQASHPFT